MKFNFYFLCIVIALPCYSMEIGQKITAVKQPRFVRYLTDDRVVIAGFYGCSVVNPNTDEEIKELRDGFTRNPYIAIHPKKKQFALSYYYRKAIISNNHKVKIYDAQTYKEIWSTTKEGKVTCVDFSSHDDAIFILYSSQFDKDIEKYNYVTDKQCGKYRNDDLRSFFALSPIEKTITVPTYHHTLRVLDSENLEFNQKPLKSANIGMNATFCVYSADASFMIFGDKTRIFVMDRNKDDSDTMLLKAVPEETFDEIAFYNADSIVAILSNYYRNAIISNDLQKSCIRYWNLKTQKRIYKQELPSRKNEGFVFSPNKEKVIVMQEAECMIWPVPKKVIQEHNNLIKEKMLFPWLILNKYQSENPNMPDDVKIYILSKLYQAHFVA